MEGGLEGKAGVFGSGGSLLAPKSPRGQDAKKREKKGKIRITIRI